MKSHHQAFLLLAAGAAAVVLFAPAAPSERTGEQLVQYQCALCHGTGQAGAPRIGDHKAWSARATVGLDGLLRSATRGRGAMPPRGGLADASDDELREAIAYMLARSDVPR